MEKNIPERLLETLQIIEGLRRSLQDIGRYTLQYGEEEGQKALWDYAGPHLYRRLTHAREQVEASLLALGPEREQELIELLNDDEKLQVWSGPAAAPPSLPPNADLLVACMARHLDVFDLDLRERSTVEEAMRGCAAELESDAAAADQSKPGSGRALLSSWQHTLNRWIENREHRVNLHQNLSAQTGYEWSAPIERDEILLGMLRCLCDLLPTSIA